MAVLVGMLAVGLVLMIVPIVGLIRRRATSVRVPATIAIVAGFVVALIGFDGLLRLVLR